MQKCKVFLPYILIILGFPSVGKSTLMNTLAGVFSEVAAYEFTTLTTVPGVIKYKGAKIQLLDLPGIIEGAKDGKGRGRQVIAGKILSRFNRRKIKNLHFCYFLLIIFNIRIIIHVMNFFCFHPQSLTLFQDINYHEHAFCIDFKLHWVKEKVCAIFFIKIKTHFYYISKELYEIKYVLFWLITFCHFYFSC